MRIAVVIVSIAFAALLAVSAAFKLSHSRTAVDGYQKAGVPESWLNGLAAVLLLAATGLAVGIWWPTAGIAAAVGLVIYFVLAVAFHVRADDTSHTITPAVLAVLAAVVVALHLMS